MFIFAPGGDVWVLSTGEGTTPDVAHWLSSSDDSHGSQTPTNEPLLGSQPHEPIN